MKRMILVIILLLAMLTACAGPGTTPTEPSKQIEFINTGGPIIIKTIEEYNTFITTDTHLPSDLPLYEDLAYLGEFNRFYYNDLLSNQFHSFSYVFTDANQVRFKVDILYYHKSTDIILNLPRVTVTDDMESMLSINDTSISSKCIERCGLYYSYVVGELSLICLYTNNMTYFISFYDADMSAYPANGQETFMSRLLSMDDEVVNAAVAEFLENVPQ